MQENVSCLRVKTTALQVIIKMTADKYQVKNNILIKSPYAKKWKITSVFWARFIDWETFSINTFLMDKKNCLLQFSVKIGAPI